MRDISDGCRGVYATVLDLIHGMHEVYRSASDLFTKNREGRTVVNRPGVVLIDEVEAHLHPSWQREIPEWLKTHFPLVQFLVSTHSPFVAQAADPNGVFVLPLQNESDRRPRALSEEEYKKLRWASAQRTLLGSAFGVPSTRSRWADRQIRHFQTLDAKAKAGAHLTPTENNERTSLEKQLELIFEDGPDEPINGIPQSRNRAS
jgi:predicted ATPase